jgi:aminopeptidase N
MLRREVGEQRFEGMLRESASRYAGKQVTTSDFTAFVTCEAGRDLEDFLARHLYGTERLESYLEELVE